MSGRQINDDASIGDLPWASVFDPAANVRALSAIQARGFRAATEVVDRFVRLTAKGAAPSVEADERQAAGGSVFPEAGEVLSSWQGLVGQLSKAVLGGASQTAAAGLDLTNASVSGEVRLEAAGGDSAVSEVWLHNRGPDDFGLLQLRASDLLAHDGALIPAATISFEPASVPMPPRCSRGVLVNAVLSEPYVPGTYRGTVLADGHPEVWLPLVLNISAAAS